jgi:regulator of sigma E protease
MNYLLALLLIIGMFAGLGRPVYEVVKSAPPENPHENAVTTYATPLETGDVILEINGKSLYLITDYIDALEGKKQGEIVSVTVIREGKEKTLDVALYEDAEIGSMSESSEVLFLLGIAARGEVTDENGNTSMQVVRSGGFQTAQVKDGFFQTIGHSFAYSVKIGGSVLRSLGELLTGKLGLDAMGGPITTIQVTSQAASSGLASFLNIASFIGVNLAVFNLLPIPALDGCKVIFCIIEWIRKKPVNRKIEAMIHFIGIIFLFGFAILVDLLQLF